MNPDISKLQPYPFEKLAQLKAGITPPAQLEHIPLYIGEPQHPTPGMISEALISHLHGLSGYPTTKGTAALRQTIADWIERRFQAAIDAETQVLPVNGTREALFSFAQAVVDRRATNPLVLCPNPFYQIYEGAAVLAGATPVFLNTTATNGFIPDFAHISEATWRDCQLLYICSPGNPTGAVIGKDTLKQLIKLADQYDFVIASDECYSELYDDEANPPPGLLEVCADIGRTDYRRCVVFHSLSKRSNAPGLRSGFVAGDAAILQPYFQYRTYHGCAMPLPVQAASAKAWADEQHVRNNREQYRAKFDAVVDILTPVTDVQRPAASFYLWLKTPGSDTDFARALFASQNITVLPGSFLSRESEGDNPGAGYVRIALVAELEQCIEAAHRIRHFIEQH